jgi:hypothetical protein
MNNSTHIQYTRAFYSIEEFCKKAKFTNYVLNRYKTHVKNKQKPTKEKKHRFIVDNLIKIAYQHFIIEHRTLDEFLTPEESKYRKGWIKMFDCDNETPYSAVWGIIVREMEEYVPVK